MEVTLSIVSRSFCVWVPPNFPPRLPHRTELLSFPGLGRHLLRFLNLSLYSLFPFPNFLNPFLKSPLNWFQGRSHEKTFQVPLQATSCVRSHHSSCFGTSPFRSIPNCSTPKHSTAFSRPVTTCPRSHVKMLRWLLETSCYSRLLLGRWIERTR